MKIRLLSDLHLEHGHFEPPAVDCDVTVLAGDIWTGTQGVRWAKENFSEPVIYVAGNHEAYSHDLPRLFEKLKKEAAGSNVTVLNNESHVIDGVTFLGCTLWTDFNLDGHPPLARLACDKGMNDYRAIRRSVTFSRLRPEDTERLHHQSKRWLTEQLQATTGPKVVVTHHLPSARSLHPGFAGDVLNAAYASHLDAMMHEAWSPPLWVHGHSHHKVDYVQGNTRVVSNPKGYKNHPVEGFDPYLTLEVDNG